MGTEHPKSSSTTAATGAQPWAPRVSSPETSTPWAALALLTVAATILRTIGLSNGLWLDEILTLQRSVRVPLLQIITVYSNDNQHTLYSVLAHLSIAALGDHIWSFRLPALIFGVATVPLLYVFGRRVTGHVEALLASALLTVAYHHVWYSQSARAYSMLAFLALLTTGLLLRALAHGRLRNLAWYALACVVCIYAHLTMIFLVVSHAALCLAPQSWTGLGVANARLRRNLAVALAVAGLVTLLLYEPAMAFLKTVFANWSVTRPPRLSPVWAAVELALGLDRGLGGPAGAAMAAVLGAVGLISYWRQSRFLVGLFVLPGILVILVPALLRRPVFPRFLFFLSGFLALVAVRGAMEVGRLLSAKRADAGFVPRIGIGLVVAVILASLVSLVPNYQLPKQDYDGAMHYLETEPADGDLVVPTGVVIEVNNALYHHESWQAARTIDQWRAARATGRRLWVVYTFADDMARIRPVLMQDIFANCVVQRVFRGSMDDGDITVCMVPPPVP